MPHQLFGRNPHDTNDKQHFLKMKKTLSSTLFFVFFMALAVLFASGKPNKSAIKKKGSTYIVNTTSITSKVHGFAGATPLKIYIANNKITRIEALSNQETPQFFERAKTLLNKYEGKTVDEAASMHVDAVSGATYSSKSLINTVKGGLKYYQNHH